MNDKKEIKYLLTIEQIFNDFMSKSFSNLGKVSVHEINTELGLQT